MPGEPTSAAAPTSSFQRGTPFFRFSEYTTPSRSATYAESSDRAAGAKNGAEPLPVQRSAPFSSPYARTLPSVQGTTARSFVSAAHARAAAGRSFFQRALPEFRSNAATTPFAPFTASGS